jgi:CRP/FNR family cyclic AMP-dependent transcriptional regulator
MRRVSSNGSSRPHIDASALLKSHPVFGALSPMQLKDLDAFATSRHVKAGATIFSKGDRGTALFAIARGSVKISAPARAGREAVLNVLNDGAMFGEIALLDGQPRTADAIAMTDCELLTIQRRDFLRLVDRDPKVAVKLIELLCARLRFATEHLEEMVYLNLPARLARTLLRLSKAAATPGTNGKIGITQQEIGQISGMTREHANKHLRAWAKNDWVRLERGGIVVLAPKALAAVAGLDENSGQDV